MIEEISRTFAGVIAGFLFCGVGLFITGNFLIGFILLAIGITLVVGGEYNIRVR